MQVFGIKESDHSDLRPPANAQSILHTIQYAKSGKAEESVRKVWHKLKYDDYEIAQLFNFETLLSNNNMALDEDWARADT